MSPTARRRSGRRCRARTARREDSPRCSHPGRERHGQRDAAGRRLRAQVEMGLRAGGGAAVEGDRRAGARWCGRARTTSSTTSTTPSRSSGSMPGSTPTARSSPGGTAAWRRRSSRPSRPAPITRRRSNSAWGWSTTRSTSRTCAARTASATAHTRIGWFRSVSNIPHAFAVQSMVAEIARRSGAIRRMCCSSCSVPIASSIRASRPRSPDFWNYGDPFETYPIDTGRLRRVAELAAEQAGGASSCRRARASASPRIAAS